MPAGPRGGRTRQTWTSQKKRKPRGLADEAELRVFFEDALELQPALCVFDLDRPGARQELADALWAEAPLLGSESMTDANRQLSAVLEVLIHNSYKPSDREAYAHRTGLRVESILAVWQICNEHSLRNRCHYSQPA